MSRIHSLQLTQSLQQHARQVRMKFFFFVIDVWFSSPLLAVLAHAHPSSMTRGGVAARALSDLESDSAAGAA